MISKKYSTNHKTFDVNEKVVDAVGKRRINQKNCSTTSHIKLAFFNCLLKSVLSKTPLRSSDCAADSLILGRWVEGILYTAVLRGVGVYFYIWLMRSRAQTASSRV
jgi:hypothetical protein